MSRRAMAASSHALAVESAIRMLRAGGNAIDAAVAATAVLGVVEPMSTGLGGDCFAIIYRARDHRLVAINGSGRAPSSASADQLLESGFDSIPLEGPHSVTVPGALDALSECLANCGTVTLKEAFADAMVYAEQGFPVTEVAARAWKRSEAKLARNAESARVYLPGGRAPEPGQIFHNPDLARTLRSISEGGAEAFYRGEIAKAIVASIRELGGAIDLRDLAEHSSDWVEPITSSYRGYEVVEMPPNTQGVAALIALNIVEGWKLSEMWHNSPEYLGCLVGAMKAALSDARKHVADPREGIPVDELLSKRRAESLRRQMSATARADEGAIDERGHGDTVYVAVVDEQRNVVSMISSIYKAFGSGITVPGTGLILQNRGACFSLDPGHPNRLGPGKRPFHTIIPAMVMRDGKPWAVLGVVGGSMQAQGHLQVICNLIDFGMSPQAALDSPRFRILDDGFLALEEGIPETSLSALGAAGHRIKNEQTEEGFGGGQVILISDEALYGGSDPRKDGCALGY
ncbi:MAG TPA: gamma-glutamyltransferase [Blastocatellia bacterium]|nr:gamma-glutamyltransferase [Blastocatellia bacterium]